MITKTIIYYYITQQKENPVKDFINSLSKIQKAKIFRIFQVVENYGIQSIPRHIKKLQGYPSWEIRILGQDNIRIIYIGFKENNILVLHGFIKKSQKTPTKEITTAIKRYHDWHHK